MGSSHGIYNPTDTPTEWLNIAVGSVRGRYDAFDLGDDRVAVPLDPKPVFMSMKLDKSLLKGMPGLHGGKGTVHYRRALGPEVFRTNGVMLIISRLLHLLPWGITGMIFRRRFITSFQDKAALSLTVK